MPPPPLAGTVANPTAPMTTVPAAVMMATATTTAASAPARFPPLRRCTILYAGMVPVSTQVPSLVSAVSGAHPGLIDDRAARAVCKAKDKRE